MSEPRPHLWEHRRLADVADLFNGKAAGTGGTWLRVFKTRHVYDGHVRLADPTFVPDHKASTVPMSTYLRSGDTLTPNMAHGTIGRVAFVRSAENNWTVDGQVMVIRPKSDNVLGRYIYDWMSRPQSRALLVSMEKGGAFDELRGQTHIYRGDVGSIPLLVPPLPEQRKIAAILSSMDEAIEGTQAVIDQLQVVKKATMADLLTRGIPGRHKNFKQTEIGEIPMGWEAKAIEHVGGVDAGKARDPRAEGTPRPYLRVANVFDGEIRVDDVYEMPFTDSEFERFRLEEGDVLLNEGQSIELVGRCSIYRNELSRPCAIQNALLRFRASGPVRAEFAEQYFRWCQYSGRFAEIATQTTSIAHLGLKRFASMTMPVPTPEEQTEIIQILSAIDWRCKNEQAALAGLKTTKAALMSVLLTGELRVCPDRETA